MRLPSGWRGWAIVAVAVVVAITTFGDLGQHYRGAIGAGLAVGFIRGVAVVACWWRPVIAVSVTVVVGIATTAVTTPKGAEAWPWPFSSTLAFGVVLVAAGAAWPLDRPGLRRTLAGAIVVAQAGAVLTALLRDAELSAADVQPALIFDVAAALVAGLVFSRRAVARDLERQEVATAQEISARLRGEERARIARELHDVVAHHLSVVVVRADSAPVRVSGLDDAAAAEFRAIGDDARQSLDQMRQVLRLLREDDVGPVSAKPQPVLADAESLFADARDAGAVIELRGELPTLTGTSGLVAYRILQEALTNALRHAPGAAVTITVECHGDHVAMAVENPAPAAGLVEGLGLTGMRERAGGAGGTVHAGHTGHGTFLVRAELPWDAAP